MSRTPMRFTVLTVLLACALSQTVLGDDATRERRHRLFQEKRQQILHLMNTDLQKVHAWCTERNLADGATSVIELARQLANRQQSETLNRFAQPAVLSSLSQDEQAWRLQLNHHRTERAAEMYTLARSALRSGFPSLAFSMILDVVRLDPDHEFARSILGQQLYHDPARSEDPAYNGEWVSPFEQEMRREGRIYDSRFGWIPSSTLARYEQGFRPWKSDWISREKEAEIRREFRNAWEVRSEHFRVKTNVSLEAGVELSEKLEVFYDWLQRNMAVFFDTPQALEKRFEAVSRSSRKSQLSRPMEVEYFATPEEYNKRIAHLIPRGIETTGFYSQPDRTSFFYQKEDTSDFSTVYHEATHQILDLHTSNERLAAARIRAAKMRIRRPTEWVLCENSNFWMIEGLACYFESLEINQGSLSVGNPEFVRFDTARQRALGADPLISFYMPMKQFCSLGKSDFQNSPHVAQLYTQASGLTHFMMHFDDGVYKDAFVQLLSAAYRPTRETLNVEPSFEAISGVTFDVLDQQYRQHMQNLDDQLRMQSNTASGAELTE
ncbi:MAG: hypothetical protein R3C20_20955 [Planctomycetaceae bacterium]